MVDLSYVAQVLLSYVLWIWETVFAFLYLAQTFQGAGLISGNISVEAAIGSVISAIITVFGGLSFTQLVWFQFDLFTTDFLPYVMVDGAGFFDSLKRAYHASRAPSSSSSSSLKTTTTTTPPISYARILRQWSGLAHEDYARNRTRIMRQQHQAVRR